MPTERVSIVRVDSEWHAFTHIEDANADAIVDAVERQAASLRRQNADDWTPTYESWRHGGWYVTNLRYPSGACGCVSRNYADKKWRIACDPRPFEEQPTFKNRDAAAYGERDLVNSLYFDQLGGYR